MKGINFVHSPQSFIENDAFVIHLPKIYGKEELLKQLSVQLRFPDYFGFNWDALLDFLCDFQWIDEPKIIIVHDDLPILNDNDLYIYFDVLLEAMTSWKNYKGGKEHLLEAVFPLNAKSSLQKHLSNLSKDDLGK